MLPFFNKKNPKKELEDRIGKYQLPAFPEIANRGLQLLRTDTSTLNDVGVAVASDPGISVNLLRIVNSAGVGLRREVESVPQAVTLLGKAQVEGLLTVIAVSQSIPLHASDEYCPVRFWTAASRRAAVSRAFSKILHPSKQSLAHSAGLLQDMAIPVLSLVFGARYDRLLAQWRLERCDLEELERKEFGFDHREIAGWMCAVWRLPEDLTAAIAVSEGAETTDATKLAGVSLSALIHEEDNEPHLENVVQQAQARHDIAPEETLALLRTAYADAEEVAKIFSR